MWRNILILAFLICAVGAYTLYSDRANPGLEKPPTLSAVTKISLPLPKFSFNALDGTHYNPEDFADKVIVLNFWATWCAPCVVEFPQMLDLARMTDDKSVFLFLSVDEKREDVKAFLKKYTRQGLPPNVFIGHDPDKIISQKLFQTYKLPETYLISPGLRIEEKIVGADVVWNSNQMRSKIESLYRAK